MNILQNKKIAGSLILGSLCILIITHLIKEPNDYTMLRFLKEEHLSVPLYLYDVNILGITLPYKSIVITFIILLSLGVYWFLYKTDNEIKTSFNKNTERGSIILLQVKTRYGNYSTAKPNEEAFDENISEKDLEQKKLADKIRITKNLSLVAGWLILGVTVIMMSFNESITKEYTTEQLQAYFIFYIIITQLYRVIVANICYNLTKYNRGDKWLWLFFGFLIPSIALIIAGLKRTLQYEYKYLLEYYKSN